jgi:hypothetical protein
LAGAVDKIEVTPAATSVVAGGSTTVNVKASDANGYPVADGTSISLLASNGSSVAPSSKTTVNGSFVSAATVVTSTGASDTTVSAVSGSKTGSAKITLTGGSSTGSLAAQIDALNAKIVALNALIAKIMKKLGVK